MKRIRSWIGNLAEPESLPFRFDIMYPEIRQEMQRRAQLVLFINIFGMAATAGLGALVWSGGFTVLVVVDYLISLTLVANTVVLLAFRKIHTATNITLGAAVFLFIMLVVIGGKDNSAALWFNVLPLLVMFLAGRKKGMIICASAIGLIAVLLFSPMGDSLLMTAYSNGFKLRIILSSVLVAYVSYVYEKLREDVNMRLRGMLLAEKATKEELVRSNEDLEEFSKTASHNLREPVRKISVFSHRLMSQCTKAADKVPPELERIQDSTQTLTKLLWALDAYSSVVRGAFSPEPVDLNKVCRNSVTVLTNLGLTEKANIEIEPLPVVWGEAVQLEALFSHLLRNALTYTSEGSPARVTIRASERKTDPGVCALEVKDNGIGFDGSLVKRAFLPFRRLNSSYGKGSVGIGLAICRRIVRRHNGTIDIRTAVGEGTSVLIALPLTKHHPA